MRWLSLDFETRSRLDITKVGVHRYAADLSTSVLCAAYAIDGGPVQQWLPWQTIPYDLQTAIADPDVYVRAWNAAFERHIWAHCTNWPQVPLERWFCSMAQAARAGIPQKLGTAAAVLGLAEQKDKSGARLIRFFCTPLIDGSFNKPEDHRVEFATFVDYCKQDVRTETAVLEALPPVGHPFERRLWLADQRINDRGVQVDTDLAIAIQTAAVDTVAALDTELDTITDGAVSAVTQVGRLRDWLLHVHSIPTLSLDGPTVVGLLDLTLPPAARRALELRQQGAKSSVAKAKAILAMADDTGRLRGVCRYYGARTGRWSGRGPQFQNLPRGSVKITETAIAALKRSPCAATLRELYPDAAPMDVLSSMLRACVVAA